MLNQCRGVSRVTISHNDVLKVKFYEISNLLLSQLTISLLKYVCKHMIWWLKCKFKIFTYLQKLYYDDKSHWTPNISGCTKSALDLGHVYLGPVFHANAYIVAMMFYRNAPPIVLCDDWKWLKKSPLTVILVKIHF